MGERLADDGLEQTIRAIAREERRTVTDHPTEHELVDYQEGRLSRRGAARVRRHIALCPDCAEDLLDLERWDAAAPADPSLLPPPARVAALEREFRRRAIETGDHPGGKPGPDHFWSGPARATALATLAAGCLAALGLGIWIGGGASDRTEMAARPFLFHLVPDGSGRERSAVGPEVDVPAGMDPLVAVLRHGDLAPYDGYRIEVVERQGGRVAWSQDGVLRQPGGTFTLLIPRAELPPGSFRLDLFASTPDGDVRMASYSFVLTHATE